MIEEGVGNGKSFHPLLSFAKRLNYGLMRLSFLLTVFFGILPFLLPAQVEIEGKVTDVYSEEPLEGVSIGLDSSEIMDQSDARGRFQVELRDSNARLSFYRSGYRTRTLEVGQPDFIKVRMEREPATMNEVVVTGFSTDDPLRETAGSVARLDTSDFERYHESSLRPTLSNEPGVRMDSRGIGGSSRISIRGSELRSPWGVRNLKAYWNGMPLTKPDGSTPIEVIDPKGLSSVEILKGPSGSLYGAGNGGVMKFQSKEAAYGERSVRAETLFGQYGLQRQASSVAVGTEKVRVNLHVGRIRNQGYREQEFVNKDHIRLNSSFYPSEQDRIDLFAYWFEGGWGLPGGLSRKEMQEDPRQAVPYSVEGNASFQHSTGRLGARHEHVFNEHWEHRLTVYMSNGSKENPYGTSPFYNGYKIENAQGAGYRNELKFEKGLGELRTEVIAGTEGQTELNALRNFDNEKGSPGDMRENSNTRSDRGLFFLQNHWYLPWNITATVGVSYNRVGYEHRDLYKQDSIDHSNDFRFSPGWVPRIALQKGIGENWALHASASEGFSAPTVWELIRPDGSVDTDLEAEKGRNYEAGIRGDLWDGRIAIDATGYWFRLRNAILAEERIGNQAVFGNQGRTEQKGVELRVDWQIHQSGETWLREAKLRQAYAYQEFVFGDFVKEGRNFKGERIPGVPFQTWNQILSLRTASGFYLEGTGRFVGKTPLNNANTDFAASYYVLDGKIGWRRSLGKGFRLHLFSGGQNLLDRTYSNFLQVNDFNGNYFNPAPGRIWYGGVALNVRW